MEKDLIKSKNLKEKIIKKYKRATYKYIVVYMCSPFCIQKKPYRPQFPKGKGVVMYARYS